VRKSVTIFCFGCVIGAASAAGVFAYLWSEAEEARSAAEVERQRAEQEGRLAEEVRERMARSEYGRTLAAAHQQRADEKAKRD
jgi:hypothetical protein